MTEGRNEGWKEGRKEEEGRTHLKDERTNK